MTGVGAGFFAAAIARLGGYSPDLELLAGVIAAASTTLPDWLEMPIIRKGLRVGSIITHRTITHWGLFWLVLLGWGLHSQGLPGVVAIGAATGSIFHLLGDAPNPMGVPWLWPTKRLRIGKNGLWRSGEYEPFLVVLFTALGVGAWYLVDTYHTPSNFANLNILNYTKMLQ